MHAQSELHRQLTNALCKQDLAATPQDSRERFEARRLLPGMAKRIREVGTMTDDDALSAAATQQHAAFAGCMQLRGCCILLVGVPQLYC